MNPNFPVAGVLGVGQQHYGSAHLNVKSDKRKAHSHIVAPAHFATVQHCNNGLPARTFVVRAGFNVLVVDAVNLTILVQPFSRFVCVCVFVFCFFCIRHFRAARRTW